MTWEQTATAHSSANRQAVWDVLSDGPRWSFWNPDVEWMWIEGEPVVGTLATIKLKRVRQTAFTIVDIAGAQRLALRLTVGPVARLDLSWTLRDEAMGTRIDCQVRITGIAAGPLLKAPAERIASALPASLERLAKRASSLSVIE